MSLHEKFPLPGAPLDGGAPPDKDAPLDGGAPPSQVIAAARGWLGTPYIHQASAKGAGSDCLGLIRGVWRELYGGEPESPPPYAPDFNERALARDQSEPLLEAARRNLLPAAGVAPGAVLIFRIVRNGPAKHCGILTAPDRFIHAYAGRAVIEGWYGRWWRERLAGAFLFPAVARAPGPATRKA